MKSLQIRQDDRSVVCKETPDEKRSPGIFLRAKSEARFFTSLNVNAKEKKRKKEGQRVTVRFFFFIYHHFFCITVTK